MHTNICIHRCNSGQKSTKRNKNTQKSSEEANKFDQTASHLAGKEREMRKIRDVEWNMTARRRLTRAFNQQ